MDFAAMRLAPLIIAALLLASAAAPACEIEDAEVEAPAEAAVTTEDAAQEPAAAPVAEAEENRRPLILDLGDITLSARSTWKAANAATIDRKSATLRLGTLKNDVLAITAVSSPAGALQLVGVGPSARLKLGVRWAAPAVTAGTTVKLMPWLGASYRTNALGDALATPSLLAETFDVNGGMNLLSGRSFAASISADWQQRPDGSAIAGLGRMRIGF